MIIDRRGLHPSQQAERWFATEHPARSAPRVSGPWCVITVHIADASPAR